VDNFTYLPHVYEYVPIVKASKTLPDWWKKLDRGTVEYTKEPDFQILRNKTMKTCYGFLEFYKKGMVLENWSDLHVTVADDYFHYYYSSGSKPESHPDRQRGEGFSKYHHLKLVSPWTTKEKTGVKFLYVGAEYSLGDYDIKVPPAIINFTFNTSTNFNFFFPKKTYNFNIDMGNPLSHIIPLSEKDIVIKNHLITRQEYDTIKLGSGSSIYGWKSFDKLIRRNKQRDASNKSCPFGFGE
jgi:hypothetical protein